MNMQLQAHSAYDLAGSVCSLRGVAYVAASTLSGLSAGGQARGACMDGSRVHSCSDWDQAEGEDFPIKVGIVLQKLS